MEATDKNDAEDQAFLVQLAADRTYFLTLAVDADEAVSQADAMRAYEVSRHCPLRTQRMRICLPLPFRCCSRITGGRSSSRAT